MNKEPDLKLFWDIVNEDDRLFKTNDELKQAEARYIKWMSDEKILSKIKEKSYTLHDVVFRCVYYHYSDYDDGIFCRDYQDSITAKRIYSDIRVNIMIIKLSGYCDRIDDDVLSIIIDRLNDDDREIFAECYKNQINMSQILPKLSLSNKIKLVNILPDNFIRMMTNHCPEEKKI